MNFEHKSVMLDEVINSLEVKPNGIYLDCTLGGGGHSLKIGEKLNAEGLLIGIDRDEEAVEAATERLAGLICGIKIVRGNFSESEKFLDNLKIDKIDGAVFDLGVSSHQIDTAERGFSYMSDAPLDMRMDRRSALNAFEVVNEYEENELVKIFRDYGEERFSGRIAAAIVEARKKMPIRTTGELVKIIENSVPRTKNGGHPAKRIFQAIRIEVNDELGILSDAIEKVVRRLKIGGRLAVITFHSLEDRIVKTTFKNLARDCICPKNFPVCVCNHRAEIKIIGKTQTASLAELKENNRAKSAKLRVAEKIF